MLGFTSCSDNGTSSNGTDLSQAEQELVGTWKHVSSQGGKGEGPVSGTFTWTFNDDRSGTYFQNPKGASEQSNDFNWKLDGDDIVYTDASGNGSPQYRIDEQSQGQMKWYNYTLADTDFAHIYIVERQ